MDNFFNRIIIILFLCLVFSDRLLAFSPQTHNTEQPYEEQVIDGDYRFLAHYLGELKGDPHMYEFSTGQEDELVLNLWQKPGEKEIPFSLIVVRLNEERGVTEVGRLKGSEAMWEEFFDPTIGVSLLRSSDFKAQLKPGIYRVEVSTPANEGRYLLQLGKEEREYGYFTTLAGVREIQSFFGFSSFSIFASSLVMYPLGLMLLVVLAYVTWRLRRRISHA